MYVMETLSNVGHITTMNSLLAPYEPNAQSLPKLLVLRREILSLLC